MNANPQVVDVEEPDDDEAYAALMTERQFRSITLYISRHWSDSELKRLSLRGKKSLAKHCDPGQVRRWLFNAWGTEFLLRQAKHTLGDDAGVGLQWAFPQAYYATFSHVHALLEASGTKVESHAKLRRAFSNLAASGKLPKALSFFASGGRGSEVKFSNIEPPTTVRPSIEFRVADEESWRHQICQFLRSTRTMGIETSRKKRKAEFRTKRGNPKERLTRQDWKVIADGCGETTLLDLLYRKRIKSNYYDVTIFSSEAMDGISVYESLIQIVQALGAVTETLIARRDASLVLECFDAYLSRRKPAFLRKRRERIVSGEMGVELHG